MRNGYQRHSRRLQKSRSPGSCAMRTTSCSNLDGLIQENFPALADAWVHRGCKTTGRSFLTFWQIVVPRPIDARAHIPDGDVAFGCSSGGFHRSSDFDGFSADLLLQECTSRLLTQHDHASEFSCASGRLGTLYERTYNGHCRTWVKTGGGDGCFLASGGGGGFLASGGGGGGRGGGGGDGDAAAARRCDHASGVAKWTASYNCQSRQLRHHASAVARPCACHMHAMLSFAKG